MLKHEYPDTHHDVSSNTIFGFWIYLMTDFILFATFFATFLVLRTGAPKIALNVPNALVESLVLLTSTFCCSMAITAMPSRKKMMTWFVLTIVFALAFIGLELRELSGLIRDGSSWQTNGYLSAYFTVVATHGLHIVAGLIVLIGFMFQLINWGLNEVTKRRLICFRMYWNFVYLLWIFTFTFVYLVGGK